METCAACGETFDCGAREGKASCWCGELPPAMRVVDARCLCPRCLRSELLRRVGACLDCAHKRVSRTKGGGVVLRCARAGKDDAYPRYPVLPVHECRGWVRESEESAPRSAR